MDISRITTQWEEERKPMCTGFEQHTEAQELVQVAQACIHMGLLSSESVIHSTYISPYYGT